MKQKRVLKTTLFVFLMVGLFSACQSAPAKNKCLDEIGCIEIPPGQPLILGVLRSEKIGPDHHRGIELALAEYNNQFLGHPIELQIEDEDCSPEGGTTAALKLVADPQLVGIIGTTCSGAAKTAMEIVSEAGLIMISGSNTAPSLTSLDGIQPADDWYPGYFRTAHNDATGALTAAKFIYHELGISDVATINDGDPYTQEFTDLFAGIFTALGGDIVYDGVVNKGDRDMLPILNAVAAENPSLVFIPLFVDEAVPIVRLAAELQALKNTEIMGAGALISDDFVAEIGEQGVGMYFINRDPLDDEAIQKISEDYQTMYGEPIISLVFAYIYDATQIMIAALEDVAVLGEDGTVYIGRQELREKLYATMDFTGVTGQFNCTSFGDCSMADFVILQLDDPKQGIGGLLENVVYSTEGAK
jgi:branched-chain amino acid transport system substrate-binding protein